MAAVVECAEGRHVAGGSSAGRPRRSGTLSKMAAPPAQNAAGTHVFVGLGWPRCAGFRNLDENGYAVHRHMVLSARLEDHAAHDSTRADGAGGQLISLCI